MSRFQVSGKKGSARQLLSEFLEYNAVKNKHQKNTLRGTEGNYYAQKSLTLRLALDIGGALLGRR